MSPRAAALLLLAAAACGSKSAAPTVHAYDRSCSSGSDCIPIFDGTPTTCPVSCPNAAINRDEGDAYQEALVKRLGPCGAAYPTICHPSLVICPSGTCELHRSSDFEGDGGSALAVSTASYPKTCATVGDCVSVYEGPLGCCGTPCPNSVISASAEAAYKAELAGHTPSCFPIPPCPPPVGTMCTGRVDCQDGMCVLKGAQ
jgi:hypothetical protein